MNIPNLLSAFRLILVPVFIVLYFNNHTAALVVFAIASATDILDGYIARRFKLITKLGAILDPIADKLMQLSVLVCLFYSQPQLYPLWALCILLGKEFLMCLGTLLLLKSGIVVSANIFGKSATVIISLCILVILIFGRTISVYVPLLALLASFAALCALVSYIISFYKNMKRAHLDKM